MRWMLLSLAGVLAGGLSRPSEVHAQVSMNYLAKRCNEDALALRLDPGPFQDLVGEDHPLLLDAGKARVLFVVQDCDEYWLDGVDLGPTQHVHVWVRLDEAHEIIPVTGAQATRPTATWFNLFAGSSNPRGREARRASRTAPEPIEGVTLDPLGPQRGGEVTVGPDLSLSWTISSAAPPVRLRGINHRVLVRHDDDDIVLKQIQALANCVSGPAPGTLTVRGAGASRWLIPAGSYPIMALTFFPIWARVNLGGPPSG